MKTVIFGILREIDFSPASSVAEIVQNVKTIISTVVGTVPLDRDFGVDSDLVDLPMPVARARLAAELIEKVERYEKRVKVLRVTFSGDGDGHLIPRLEVDILEQ